MDEENLKTQNGMFQSLNADFQNLNYEKRKELSKESLASDQEFGDGDPCLYLEGDLVWANVKGSPLWPAMITIPQNETFYTKFRLKKSTKEPVGPRQYHVQFFCDNYRTMWVSSKTIFIYEGLKNLRWYCKKLKLYVKSCKNANLSSERNLLKAFSKLSSRTMSSNNSKSLQWNQAVLEADQILPLERCERILKFEAPLVKEIRGKYLYETSVVEANYDAKSSISSLMSTSIDSAVSASTSINNGKWKSSSSCYSSDEFSGFEEDYSMERRKPKRRNSLKRLKQRREKDLLDSELDIKQEIEIKEEPLELCDEYLCHESELNYESMTSQQQTSGLFHGVLDSLKSIGEESVKIEADNEDKIEGEDIEIKTEFFSYMEDDNELKIEVQRRYIGDENLASKVEDNTPNHDSHVEEETLFHRLENSEFQKVVVRRLNIGTEKASEICSGNASNSACRSNFEKIDVKHGETFDEDHEADTEDNDCDKKADIDVKNEDVEDLNEDQSHNLNKDVVWKRNFGAKRREITNEPKEIMGIFDSTSPSSSSSSRLRNRKRNIIEQKNEEQKNEGTNLEDFESRKRIKLNSKFECSLCEFKTNWNGSLKRHSLVHSTEKLFKCSECDYECNRKGNLKLHLLSHSNTKLFKCSECDFECNQKGHLKLHLLTHLNTKLFKCFECDYECIQKGNLKRHLLTHSNTKFFKCFECDYECNHKGNLKLHLLSHSNLYSSKENCDREESIKREDSDESLDACLQAKVAPKSTLKCLQCSFEAKSKAILKKHLLVHSDKKLFKCSECGYGTNKNDTLKKHLLIHTGIKMLKCSECDYGTNDRRNFKIHLLKHKNIKLYKCSKCNHESNYKGHFNDHLLTHSDNKKFKCLECSFETNYKGSLKNHILSHLDTKLFKCCRCSYECNKKDHLKRHLLTHTGKKLFICEQCGFETNYNDSLKRHLLTHSYRNLFKCSECSYESNLKASLNRHMLTHSNFTTLGIRVKRPWGYGYESRFRALLEHVVKGD